MSNSVKLYTIAFEKNGKPIKNKSVLEFLKKLNKYLEGKERVKDIANKIITCSKFYEDNSNDKKIINFLLFVIIETLIFILLLIKDENVTDFHNLIIFTFLVVTLISFIKFIIILTLMFKTNMNAMVREIDSKVKYEEKIVVTLENIEKKIK